MYALQHQKPIRINIIYIDIATHPLKNTSVALSDKVRIHVWGECGRKTLDII
jgi:hypothetical protein